MAGEDLLEGADGGTNDDTGTPGKGKKKKPLSQGQKIGVVIGVVTILLVIYQIRKGQASSADSTTTTTSSTTPIDPQTGYPSGSAEDQAALATLSSTGSSSYGSSGSSGVDPTTGESYNSEIGTDPSTGQSYSSEIGANTTLLSTLGTDFTSLENQFSALQGEVIPPAGVTSGTGPGSSVTTTTSTPPSTTAVTNPGPTALQSANLANLEAQLKRDSAGNTKGDKASVPVLQKQIAAVKARS